MKKTLLKTLLENDISAEDVRQRMRKLLHDRDYVEELIDTVLDAEDKANTPHNRADAYKFIKFKYIRDIAREQLENEKRYPE